MNKGSDREKKKYVLTYKYGRISHIQPTINVIFIIYDVVKKLINHLALILYLLASSLKAVAVAVGNMDQTVLLVI